MTINAKQLAIDLVAQLKAVAADSHELEVALTEVQIVVLEEIGTDPGQTGLNLMQRNQKALRNLGAEKVLRDRAAATGTTFEALRDAAAATIKVRSDVIEPLQVLATLSVSKDVAVTKP